MGRLRKPARASESLWAYRCGGICMDMRIVRMRQLTVEEWMRQRMFGRFSAAMRREMAI
jgi:hypothetical protein